MRKTVHLCLSSHDEVLFRSEADLNMGFNCLAVAVLETESRLMAEGMMSTHYHILLQTDNYKEMMRRMRFAYTRYFGAKYSRRGKFGERQYFTLTVEGLYHTVAALNYVLRQGLHHGMATTPFEYPHCSVNTIFRCALGKTVSPPLMSSAGRAKYLPSNVRVPESYRMGKNGLLLREDIVDVAYVEEIYINPRSFLFHMNRVMSEEDFRRQHQENDTPPVTMETIETGVYGFSLLEAKVFEQGRVDRSRMTDLELCEVIDNRILPRLLKENQRASIYQLPESRRADIANVLWKECRESKWRQAANGFLSGKVVTEQQLRRCLALCSS